MPKFAQTSCSQCGHTFGPGDHGYSHCDDHEAKAARESWWRDLSRRGDPLHLTNEFKAFEAGYVSGRRAERERMEVTP